MEILSLGEKIKKKRKELNMTLKDLAGERITPGQISLVESGRSNPSMDLLEYLSNKLDTSVEYLMESELTQAEKICAYCENMANNCMMAGDEEKAVHYIEMAKSYVEKYDMPYMKAQLLFIQSDVMAKKGDYINAQEALISANVIFMKNNFFEEMTKTFLRLGQITFDLKAYHSASTYFGQADKSYVDGKIENKELLSEIYFYRALTSYKLEKDEEAQKYISMLSENLHLLSDRKQNAYRLLSISEEYANKGDYAKALEYSNKASDEFKIYKSEETLSNIEDQFGMLLYRYNKNKEALTHLKKSKDIRVRNNDKTVSNTLLNICEVLIRDKDLEQCEQILYKLMNMIPNNDYESMLRLNKIKYRIAVLHEDFQEAEDILKKMDKIAIESKDKNLISQTSILFSRLYLNNKKYNEARKYLDNSINIMTNIGLIK